MFAIPGIIGLLSFIYLRPQEFVPLLGRVPFLYLFVLATALGWAVDVRLGFTPLRPSPLLPWGVAYFGWSLITLLVAAPATLLSQALLSFVSFFLFVALAQAVTTVRGLRVIAAVLLALSLVLAVVGIHQAHAPLGCAKQDDMEPEIWRPDGRSCVTRLECAETSLETNARYRCERIGLFGTISVEGRVKYRGIMEDPNELALVISLALPFAFAFFQSRPSLFRALFCGLAFVAVGLCTVYTRSRSGQLAFLAVVGVYLLRRIGWKGALAAAFLGLPVLWLGGRADTGADQSTLERIECWSTAIDLFRQNPLFGVGTGQFTEHHHLTAHNSFLLAVAELGLLGLLLWTAVIYFAVKCALFASRVDAGKMGTRVWSNALLASLCAFVVSASFLSLTEHNVVWIYLGLVAALASVMKRHHPEFQMNPSRRDFLFIGLIDVGLVSIIFVYTRLSGL